MALTYVHADRYFGHYRGKNGHMASTREPTRLTPSGHRAIKNAAARLDPVSHFPAVITLLSAQPDPQEDHAATRFH